MKTKMRTKDEKKEKIKTKNEKKKKLKQKMKINLLVYFFKGSPCNCSAMILCDFDCSGIESHLCSED